MFRYMSLSIESSLELIMSYACSSVCTVAVVLACSSFG